MSTVDTSIKLSKSIKALSRMSLMVILPKMESLTGGELRLSLLILEPIRLTYSKTSGLKNSKSFKISTGWSEKRLSKTVCISRVLWSKQLKMMLTMTKLLESMIGLSSKLMILMQNRTSLSNTFKFFNGPISTIIKALRIGGVIILFTMHPSCLTCMTWSPYWKDLKLLTLKTLVKLLR